MCIVSLKTIRSRRSQGLVNHGSAEGGEVLGKGTTNVKRLTNSAFSMIEIMIVIAISILLAGIAIPIMTNAMNSYRQNAAVAAASGAISATRFQAIMRGYPYEIIFTSSTMSYQVYNEPSGATCPPTFSALGTAIPLPAAGNITITQSSATYTFNANGTVYGAVSTTSPCPNSAIPTLQIKNAVRSNTITVTGVGNVQTASP